MDAGPMIDTCYRLQNPELFKDGVAWIPSPDTSFATPNVARMEDTPSIGTWCAICQCDHGLPADEVVLL